MKTTIENEYLVMDNGHHRAKVKLDYIWEIVHDMVKTINFREITLEGNDDLIVKHKL